MTVGNLAFLALSYTQKTLEIIDKLKAHCISHQENYLQRHFLEAVLMIGKQKPYYHAVFSSYDY